MGLFDSLYIKCPTCKRQLEFQSKSGPCCCLSFKEKNLPVDVAVGMNGDIVSCEFCNINWKLDCEIPKIVKVKLIKTNQKADYRGNYNPENLDVAEKEILDILKPKSIKSKQEVIKHGKHDTRFRSRKRRR